MGHAIGLDFFCRRHLRCSGAGQRILAIKFETSRRRAEYAVFIRDMRFLFGIAGNDAHLFLFPQVLHGLPKRCANGVSIISLRMPPLSSEK